MLAKVVGGNSGWDVVFPTHNRLEPMRVMTLLAPLRHEWLPGLTNLDARFRAPAWDAALQWGVPYMWNGTGIVYHRGLNPPPARWADLWNSSLKGRLTMLDDPEDMLGACLKKLGLPFSATDPVQLARAEREAITQKPLLRAYLNSEVRDQLVAGDVLAAQLWSTTAQQAIDAAPHLAFVYPAEGFPLYCDCAVILRESRNRSRGPEDPAGLVYQDRRIVQAVAVLFVQANGDHEAVFDCEGADTIAVAAGDRLGHAVRVGILPAENHGLGKCGDGGASIARRLESILNAPEVTFAITVNCQNLADRDPDRRRRRGENRSRYQNSESDSLLSKTGLTSD